MKLRNLPSYLLLLAAVGSPLLAQETSKTYSYHSSQNGAKQSREEIEDIGEIDEKQGLKSFRDKLRFNVTARGAYTTNALLDGSHSSSDVLFLPTVEAGFRTPLGEKFTFDLSTKLESAIYSKYDDRGFVGYSAMATLDYRFKKGLPRVYASLEPYRYDSFDTG